MNPVTTPLCKALILALAAASLLGAASAATAQDGAKPVCPPTTAYTTALDHMDGYRVFTGSDGLSKVVPYHLDAKHIPLLKTGKQLGEFEFFTAPKIPVHIVVGPPNLQLPMHAAPSKELFILLGGSVTLKTATFSAEMKPGSLLLFEDTDAKDGHGGVTGPCGYISVSIAP